MMDKLGCYRVGDLKFHSKLEAVEMHSRTGIHPHWDFNEAVFSAQNWLVEPQESLDELYRSRAQQLRSKYDHIVLFYSGGADSQNVLNTFLHNEIKLDEIATFTNYEATGDRDQFFNAETFRVALPTITRLQEKYPYLKHRVIDLTQPLLDVFVDPNYKFDWIYNSNTIFNPLNMAKGELPYRIKEWHDLLNQGKRLCLLWGHDKPRLWHIDGKFCFRFIDCLDNGPTVRSMSGANDYADELFYWTPDLPQIVIKQSHIIKNYLNQHATTSPFVSTAKSDLAFKIVDGRRLWLSNHGVHSLIYPGWDISTFSVGKSPSPIFSLRDDWFWSQDPGSHAARDIWHMGINKLWTLTPDYWRNDPNRLDLGLKGCVSPDYYLDQ